MSFVLSEYSAQSADIFSVRFGIWVSIERQVNEKSLNWIEMDKIITNTFSTGI